MNQKKNPHIPLNSSYVEVICNRVVDATAKFPDATSENVECFKQTFCSLVALNKEWLKNHWYGGKAFWAHCFVNVDDALEEVNWRRTEYPASCCKRLRTKLDNDYDSAITPENSKNATTDDVTMTNAIKKIDEDTRVSSSTFASDIQPIPQCIDDVACRAKRFKLAIGHCGGSQRKERNEINHVVVVPNSSGTQ